MELGVEGMMLSLAILRQGADQKALSRPVLARALVPRHFVESQRQVAIQPSKLFLEFLMASEPIACTPWGMPTYNVLRLQKPCYLLQDGYVDTSRSCSTLPSGRTTARSRQSEVRELHGTQWLRSLGRGSYVQRPAWTMGDCKGGVVHQIQRFGRAAMLMSRPSRCTLTTLSFRSIGQGPT